MAKQLLTALQCDNARIHKGEKPDQLLADGSGLFLRVRRQRGATTKTWLFVYTIGGKRGKQGLGVYPDVSLARARELAQTSREAVGQGADPVRAAEAAENERRAQEAAKQGRPTVLGLFMTWHELEASARKDGGAEIKRALEKDVLPVIGAMYADEVRRRDVMRILDEVKKRGVRRYANYLLQYLRQMFKFAIVREIISLDPTFGIERKDVGGRTMERDRVLTELELHELGSKLSGAALSESAQAAYWFILATCCRVGELSKARWSEFDEETKTWLIPAEHSKNGREHLVHLSSFALKELEIFKRNATSKVWLFPAAQGRHADGAAAQAETHADPKSLQRQYRDRQREHQIKGRSKQLGALALKSGRWTIHDLRRTGATMMGELGVRSDVIDRVLNHVEERKVTRTYQRQELMAEREEAFAILGDRLAFLLREKPGKVVRGRFSNAA